MDSFFPIHDNNYFKIISYEALLPNLRFKNNNVYFVSKNPIKIKKNDKIDYINEYILENISLTCKIKCINTELNCTILEKEDKNGLIVNIKFRDETDIYKHTMQKFARAAEAAILGIDLMEDYESSEIDTNNDYISDNTYYTDNIYYDNDRNIDNYQESYDNYDNYDNYDDIDEYFEEDNEYIN
jgi:hypothetical protein